MTNERPKALSVEERKLLVEKALKTEEGAGMELWFFDKLSDEDLRLWADDLTEDELAERFANSDFPEGLEPVRE
jgi:hypothetical protein